MKTNNRFIIVLDTTFKLLPILVSLYWFLLALWTIHSTSDWFGATRLEVLGNIHSLSVIAVCSLYIVVFLFFNTNLSTPVRVITAATFVSLGTHFNGIIWSTLNLFIGSGTGMPQLNIAITFLICVILYALQKKYNVIKFRPEVFIPFFLIFAVSIEGFVESGFFTYWRLYEQGLHPDPHNWQWGLEQFIAIWFPICFIRRNSD